MSFVGPKNLMSAEKREESSSSNEDSPQHFEIKHGGLNFTYVLEKFKITLEQIFLTVGQNNYGNKIPFPTFPHENTGQVKKMVFCYQNCSDLL